MLEFVGFMSQSGTVTFDKPAGIIYIRGNNTWYVFECVVPGLSILFENNRTQSIVTGGIFRVRGTAWGAGTQISLDRITPGANPTTPVPGVEDPLFWFFDLVPGATMDMQFVDVWYSNARSNPTNIPPDVHAGYTTPVNQWDFKWLAKLYALYSYIEDSDYNGKIDRLRITTEAAVGNDFSNFDMEVEGYDIDRTKGVNGFERPLAGVTLYVYLKEKTYLDSDATPRWRVTSNTSLKDEGTNSKIFGTLETGTSDYMIPGDTAWPIIGYTLAVPLYPRGFIHFSEPVVTSGGATPAAADLDFAGGLNIVSQTGLGVSEAEGDMAALNLTTLRAGVTMINPVATLKDIGTPPYWDVDYDVLSPGAPAPTYPPSAGYTADPNAYATFGLPWPALTRPDFELQRVVRDQPPTEYPTS